MASATIAEASTADRHDAFISYAHDVDGELATALRSALRRIASPWYRPPALRIWRDTESLGADPQLWPTIERALAGSNHFVLLASEAAARSPHVERELRYWFDEVGGPLPIIVRTDGVIAWDADAGDFDWERTTALPPALARRYDSEPRWVDMSFARGRRRLSLRDLKVQLPVADIAAPLRGESREALLDQERRQHRRALWLARGAVVTLIALTVAAVFAALQAVQGRREAQTQRDRAQEQTRIAISRQLAADSGAATGEGRPDLSLLLAAQARRVKPTPQADDAVLAALNAVPQVVRVTPLPEHRSLATSADGRVAAVVTQAGRLEVRRVGRSSIVAAWPFASTPMQLAVTGDGALAVASSELGAVSIFRRGRKRPVRFAGPEGGLSEESGFDGSSIAIAPRTRLVAWNGHRVSVYNGRRRTFLPFPGGIVPGAWNLSFNADGTRLAAASDGTGEVVVWTLTTGGRSIGAPLRFQAGRGTSVLGWGPGVASIAFSPTDPARLVTGGFDGSVTLRDASTGRSLREIHAGSHGIDVAFSADGRRLLTRGDDAGRVWTLGATPHSTRFTLPQDYGAIGFGADGRRVLAAGKTALAEVSLQAPPAQTAWTLNGPTEDIGAIAIDPRGRWLATLDLYGDIDLWDLRTLTPRGREFYASDAVDLRFSDDGRTLLAWSNTPGRLRMWDVASGAAKKSQRGRFLDARMDKRGRVTAVVLAGHGLEVRSGAARRPLERSTDSGPVLLAPDGRTVVGAISKGRAARLWDAATGRVRIARMPWTSQGLAYDPTGRYLAIGDTDLHVSLWDAHSGRRAGVLEDADFVQAIAFDHRGRVATLDTTFAGTSSTSELSLWNVRTGRRLQTRPVAVVTGSADNSALAFTPDDRAVAALGLGSRPLVVDTDPARWAARACAVAGRDLTHDEWQRYLGGLLPYGHTCAS